MKALCMLGALALATGGAFAQATPAGLWKTIDDNTKQERSLVRIVESAGVFIGRVEKSLNPNADKSAVCDKCTDDRKGKPMIGLELIRNIKQNAEDKEIFDGGEIVDPDNGKTYRLRLKPLEGGKKLEVRGYIGPFFRNQTWLRVE